MKNNVQLLLCFFTCWATSSLAFQTPATFFSLSSASSSGASASAASKHTSARHVIPPESMSYVHSLLTDYSVAESAATLHLDAIWSSFAVATTAEAGGATENVGLWAQYLNIFKGTLLLVHKTIDGPLRSMGLEQTWGVSIAVFTATIRSLLLPLSLQQSKSSEYVKALKPYMAEIREKFKDNKDAQNRAIGKLYEDANQNPLAGCLVSVAQLPIFLGLYRGVNLLAKDNELDESFLWIPSLEGPVSAASDYRGLDWLTQGWHDGIPSLGWETTIAFLIMPVLLVLGQSLSMRILTPPVDDDSMGEEEKEQMEKSQVILKFLPLLIGFFSLQVPAALTIYWFTSNWFTLAQSLAVRAYYKANPPQIELPDYWDALDNTDGMSPEEKRKAAEAGISVGPKWEDLLEEANYHVLVDRSQLREQIMALSSSTTTSMNSKQNVPPEFHDWVGAPSASTNPGTTTELQPATASTSTGL